ncbi:MAG TPA: hypothetical protein PKE69_19615 [Pyrinomonadaceae bacterium]|nr:hypothetical protein [Pyrinomonadaceae bacterium]
MKSKTIKNIFAVIVILAAIFTFDHTNFNKVCISIILLLNGIIGLIYDASFNMVDVLLKWCRRVMYSTIIILLAKLLIYGF